MKCSPYLKSLVPFFGARSVETEIQKKIRDQFGNHKLNQAIVKSAILCLQGKTVNEVKEGIQEYSVNIPDSYHKDERYPTWVPNPNLKKRVNWVLIGSIIGVVVVILVIVLAVLLN